MDNLPATGAASASVPATGKRSAMASVKDGTLKMLGKVRTEAGEAIHAAGVSVEKLHRRVMLVIAGLLLMLFLGALFRSFGMLWVNYLLIALFGLGAIYAFLQPMHLAGMLLVGGGVAAVRGLGTAESALLGYARVLGRIGLALLIPLLLFALAPGDRSLGSSLPFIALAPVVVLAMWLFGRVAPGVEKFVFVALPLGALLISVTNMLIPERMLAALGVPVWLRTARPQDDELAAVETAMEKRRNEALATQLREIRRKVEAGETLTAEDEAVVAGAKQERVTLTGWIEQRLAALGQPSKTKPAATPAAGSVWLESKQAEVPAKGWSASLAVLSNQGLCEAPGWIRVRWQCHPAGKGDGIWYEPRRCRAVAVDRIRLRSRANRMMVSYTVSGPMLTPDAPKCHNLTIQAAGQPY